MFHHRRRDRLPAHCSAFLEEPDEALVGVEAPVAPTDLLDGTEIVVAGPVALGERDVRVFRSRG
ncbi:hypothetical protein [Lentzea terrae]|uniref:hypothetical protein n=1 Tax=Lentzea terrae TaxID=2200761 RepID=UPI001E60189A|nr:hypothetical protein [Lentzea terrae]